MPTYRDEGVVLRTHRLGEADRIITVFTRHHGKVRAVAKGVRRTKSRFGARLEPFSHVDVQCHIGRSLDVVTQVECLHAYGPVISGHWPAWTAGQAMLEAADKLVSEDKQPATAHYALLLGGLNAIATGARDPALALDAYLLRACAVAGYAPALDLCVACGGTDTLAWFHVASGGVMCAQCREPGATTISHDALALMVALLAGDWITAEGLDERARAAVSVLAAAHLQWNLERPLRSLTMVDRGVSSLAPHDDPEAA